MPACLSGYVARYLPRYLPRCLARYLPGYPAGYERGFTLIELMIAVSVLSILLLLGMPAFGTYLQNAKLRSAADNFFAGVQLARAEAVRRNAAVQIALTTDFPDAGAANTGNLSTTAPNWIIRVQDPATLLYDFVEGKAGTEGAGSAQSSVQITGTVSSITFNGFGRASTAATVAITSPTGGACAPVGPMRCLNIVVSLGGQARMCDPGVTPAAAAAGDTRAC